MWLDSLPIKHSRKKTHEKQNSQLQNSVSNESLDLCSHEISGSQCHKPLLENLQEKSQICDIAELRSRIQTRLLVLSGELNSVQDEDTLKNVRHLITSAMNLIKARTSSVIFSPVTKKEPANKKIEQQRSFFSTKRKRKQTNVRMKKPTANEKDDICTILLDTQTSLYGTKKKLPLTKNIISKCIHCFCIIIHAHVISQLSHNRNAPVDM